VGGQGVEYDGVEYDGVEYDVSYTPTPSI